MNAQDTKELRGRIMEAVKNATPERRKNVARAYIEALEFSKFLGAPPSHVVKLLVLGALWGVTKMQIDARAEMAANEKRIKEAAEKHRLTNKHGLNVVVGTDCDDEDVVTATISYRDDKFGLVSVAKAALSNKKIEESFMDLVRLVAIEFCERNGFKVSSFEVVSQADLN